MHIIATSSGLKTADGAICARPCILHGIKLIAGSTASAAVLYDHASAASGKVVGKAKADPALESGDDCTDLMVECNNGLYLDISGTDAEAIVYFSLL